MAKFVTGGNLKMTKMSMSGKKSMLMGKSMGSKPMGKKKQMAKKVTIRGVKGSIGRSDRKGKKWKFTPNNPNLPVVHAGAKGMKIKPGTPAGDSFCARSSGIKRKAGQTVSPNDLARFAWNCSGKKSIGRKSKLFK